MPEYIKTYSNLLRQKNTAQTSRYFRALFSDSQSPVPPGKDKAAIDKKSSKIPPVSKPKNAKFNTNFHIGIFARENTVYVIYVDNFF